MPGGICPAAPLRVSPTRPPVTVGPGVREQAHRSAVDHSHPPVLRDTERGWASARITGAGHPTHPGVQGAKPPVSGRGGLGEETSAATASNPSQTGSAVPDQP
ncbi:hypothetical protein GCM10012286_51160 [Streptomyces lasiicapitis]|uniref:Uncharacterized protein n=1 Tax=Streptomyces lasiicapitis TaxID=1923961 RepID=A0ABQ2MF21_9ACTN|nr:hypothetical protein GCM10012286_51160 [Streptomyces lasiicapitis]